MYIRLVSRINAYMVMQSPSTRSHGRCVAYTHHSPAIEMNPSISSLLFGGDEVQQLNCTCRSGDVFALLRVEVKVELIAQDL